MANNGKSSDNTLLRRLRKENPLKVFITTNDDPLMIRLKQYAELYLLFWIRSKVAYSSTTRNIWLRSLTKVLVKMNQLRQKHWYWKEINE